MDQKDMPNRQHWDIYKGTWRDVMVLEPYWSRFDVLYVGRMSLCITCHYNLLFKKVWKDDLCLKFTISFYENIWNCECVG